MLCVRTVKLGVGRQPESVYLLLQVPGDGSLPSACRVGFANARLGFFHPAREANRPLSEPAVVS